MTPRRWISLLSVLLVISVAINLFAAGAAIRIIRQSPALQAAIDMGAPFPPELRRATARAFLADREAFSADLATYRAARVAMLEAMRAPDIDDAEVDRRMAEVRAATTALQIRAQSVFKDVMAKTDAGTRAKIDPSLFGRDPIDRLSDEQDD